MRYALALAGILAIAGCQSGPSVEGKWTVEDFGQQAPGMQTTVTFTKPDKAMLVAKVPILNASLVVEFSGTYAVENDVLKLDLKDMAIKNEGIPDAMWSQISASLESERQRQMDELAKYSSLPMTWDGKDKFSLQAPEFTAKFTRVVE